MPSNAQLTIADGKSTPVDHTFSPMKIEANGLAKWNERVGDTLVGQPKLTWHIRDPQGGGNGTYKVQCKLSVPKVIVTTDSTGKSVTSVDYTALGTIEMVVSQRSTQAERKDLRVMLANALLNTTLATSADNVESFW